MSSRRPDPVAELARQRAILERQERQYAEAAPRSRFAYAAHITKTEAKIRRLERDVAERGHRNGETIAEYEKRVGPMSNAEADAIAGKDES
jgi:hypothetical protein